MLEKLLLPNGDSRYARKNLYTRLFSTVEVLRSSTSMRMSKSDPLVIQILDIISDGRPGAGGDLRNLFIYLQGVN